MRGTARPLMRNRLNVSLIFAAICLGNVTAAPADNHAEGSAGSHCVACHMPLIEQTIKDNYVAAHTFRFITPKETDLTGIPNPCTSCHRDKSTAWAPEQLKGWTTISPWRVAN